MTSGLHYPTAKSKIVLSMLLIWALCLSLRASDEAAHTLLRSQFEAMLLSKNPLGGDPMRNARALREDGSWADVDYQTSAIAGWPAMRHLNRTEGMVLALRKRQLGPDHEEILLKAVHAAFAYWIKHDFMVRGPGTATAFGGDDWNNAIGAPQVIGTIAILLGADLNPAERRFATKKSLTRFPISREHTGANTASMALLNTMLGILNRDAALLDAASRLMWDEIRTTTGEGIQPDYSFHQHGAQLQFGQYGINYARDLCDLIYAYRNTPWQVPGERLAVLRRYLGEGLQWASYRGTFDLNSNGRFFYNVKNKVGNCIALMQLMRQLDPAHEDLYHGFVARNSPPFQGELNGSRFFWRSAYLIHRQGDFFASIKLSSRRNVAAESFGGDNRSGYHLGDGVTFFHHRGDEYDDIFPVWDWRKLPGTTCSQERLRQFKTTWVETNCAGGVSDGSESVVAFLYDRDGVKARKAWFASDRSLVALGADIEGRSKEGILTTVDQCLLRDKPRLISKEGSQPLEAGAFGLQGAEAIEHNGLRYEFLTPMSLAIRTGPVTGNWRSTWDTPNSRKEDVTRATMLLVIDHGKESRGGGYAYVVSRSAVESGVRVLRNDDKIQATRFRTGTIGIVFWAAGRFVSPEGQIIEADRECVILVRQDSLVVADPYHRSGPLGLIVNGRRLIATRPGGEMAGSPVFLSLPR